MPSITVVKILLVPKSQGLEYTDCETLANSKVLHDVVQVMQACLVIRTNYPTVEGRD